MKTDGMRPMVEPVLTTGPVRRWWRSWWTRTYPPGAVRRDLRIAAVIVVIAGTPVGLTVWLIAGPAPPNPDTPFAPRTSVAHQPTVTDPAPLVLDVPRPSRPTAPRMTVRSPLSASQADSKGLVTPEPSPSATGLSAPPEPSGTTPPTDATSTDPASTANGPPSTPPNPLPVTPTP